MNRSPDMGGVRTSLYDCQRCPLFSDGSNDAREWKDLR
jgi:hypothetical protein